MFRYTPKDLYLILYVTFIGIIPFAMIYFQPPFIWWVVMFPFHMWGIVNAMNSSLHHHSHWPTFVNKKANKIYEVYLSAILGIPHQLWKWAHISHHCFVNDKPINGKTNDPVSVFKDGKNGEPENFWHYCY
jgi:fatty acid desaturase